MEPHAHVASIAIRRCVTHTQKKENEQGTMAGAADDAPPSSSANPRLRPAIPTHPLLVRGQRCPKRTQTDGEKEATQRDVKTVPAHCDIE